MNYFKQTAKFTLTISLVVGMSIYSSFCLARNLLKVCSKNEIIAEGISKNRFESLVEKDKPEIFEIKDPGYSMVNGAEWNECSYKTDLYIHQKEFYGPDPYNEECTTLFKTELTIIWGQSKKKMVINNGEVRIIWNPRYNSFLYTEFMDKQEKVAIHLVKVSKNGELINIKDELLITKRDDWSDNISWSRDGKRFLFTNYAQINIFDVQKKKIWTSKSLIIKRNKASLYIHGRDYPKSLYIRWAKDNRYLVFVLYENLSSEDQKVISYCKLDVTQFGLH